MALVVDYVRRHIDCFSNWSNPVVKRAVSQMCCNTSTGKTLDILSTANNLTADGHSKHFIYITQNVTVQGGPKQTRPTSLLPQAWITSANFSAQTFRASLRMLNNTNYFLLSVLWRRWLDSRKGTRPVKTDWWGTGMVICLQRSANDLHMVQLMPLPPHHLLLK